MPKRKVNVRIWVHVRFWPGGKVAVYINRQWLIKGKPLRRAMVGRIYVDRNQNKLAGLVLAIEKSRGKVTRVLMARGWSAQIDR